MAGELKVGAKVTIEYRMNVATIEVKDAVKKETKKAAKKLRVFDVLCQTE